MMEYPGELRYTESDEWVRVEGKLATVGITDYAQEQLSDIVFVEIQVGVGEEVARGDTLAAVESVKAAADVYVPVSGKVVEINEGLPESPELVNSQPYGGAWMIKLELSEVGEVQGLMDAGAYQKYCEERDH
jgi:glycine cleavage system H protein